MDRLKKPGSPSTAQAGIMLGQRSAQFTAVNAARAACERYQQFSTDGRPRMTTIGERYGMVGSWLDGAAKADPIFNRSKPYAKVLERSALSNAVEITRVKDWVGGVQSECAKELAWLADTSAKGPMAHFDSAVGVTKAALVDP